MLLVTGKGSLVPIRTMYILCGIRGTYGRKDINDHDVRACRHGLSITLSIVYAALQVRKSPEFFHSRRRRADISRNTP